MDRNDRGCFSTSLDVEGHDQKLNLGGDARYQ